jgi:hypothetical protein
MSRVDQTTIARSSEQMMGEQIMAEQVVALRLQQSLYAAASRHLSQISGVVLLLLADRQSQRAHQHLPGLKASASVLKEHLAAADLPRASRIVLEDIRQRLAAMVGWLEAAEPVEMLSDRDTDAILGELQRLRRLLIDAGQRSCRFSMIHFASGCCCGQHAAPALNTAQVVMAPALDLGRPA